MGVGRRISVAGEMLCHREHAIILQTTGEGDAVTSHRVGIFAERAHTDGRIVGVVVHIEHGCKIHVYADSATLACHFTAIFIEQTVIVDCAENHILGELGGIFQSHRESPLGIDGDEQRYFAQSLSLVVDSGLRQDVAAGVEQTAYFVFLHHLFRRFERSRLGTRCEVKHHQLCNLLIECEPRHRGIDPVVHCIGIYAVENLGLTSRCYHRSRHCNEHGG